MLFPAVRFHIPFQKSPLIGFSCLFVTQYFFVLFGIGEIGIIVAFILNVVLLLLSIRLLVKRKSRNDLYGILLPAFIFFLLMFFFGFIFRNRFYTGWDELAFWDAFIRSLYITGEKSATIVHADYPLGISLIQYYFVAITKYSQGIIIFGIFSVLFSGILFCCPNFSKKNIVYFPVVMIFSILLLYFCDLPPLAIRVDGLMGIFFGALIFMIFTEENQDFNFAFQLAILLFFFVSLKTLCIIFVAILFLALLTNTNFFPGNGKGNNIKKFSICKPKIYSLIIIILSPMIAFFSWEIRNQIVKPMKVFSTSRLTFQNIQLLFSANLADRERKICEDGLAHLFKMDFYGAKTPVFILISGLLFVALLIFIIEKTNNSKKFLKLNITLLLGFIGYTIFLFLFALFIQEPELGEELNSFDRYIGTYLIAWAVSFFAILIWMISKAPSSISKKFLSAISVLIFFYVFTTTPIKQIFSPPIPEKSIWIQQKLIYKQFNGIIPEGSVVQVIDLDSSGLSCLILNNLFVGHSYFIWDPCSDPADFEINKNEFANYIEKSGADYILVQHGNDHFWKEFSEMFDYPWHGQLFKVVGRGDYQRVLPEQ